MNSCKLRRAAVSLQVVIRKPSCAFSCSPSAANFYTFDSILFLGIFHFCCAMSHEPWPWHKTSNVRWMMGRISVSFVLFFSLFLFCRSFNEIQIQHTRISIFFFVRSAIQRRRVSMDSDLRSKLFISLLFLSRLAATVRVHDYAKMVRM